MKAPPPQFLEQSASIVTVLVGGAVIAGWALDVTVLKSILPGMTAMQAITAICFILCGVALWIEIPVVITKKARSFVIFCSLVVFLAAASTLVEHLYDLNLNLDEALFQDLVTTSISFPERMTPYTALGFVFISTALLLFPQCSTRLRLAGVGLFALLTALLGLFAVLARIGSITLGIGWAESTSMALHSGFLFLILGSACLARAWRKAGQHLAIGSRLLSGFGLGLVIFVILGMVSYKSARQLAGGADWVRHTHEVLTKIQEVNSDLIGMQSGVRGLIITGKDEFLTPYYESLPKLKSHERALRRLTVDNPRQQERLVLLEILIEKRLRLSDETLQTFRDRGREPAAALISTGRGQQLMDKFESIIGALELEERNLLSQREAKVRILSARTFFILFFGTFIGFGLLLVVLFFLNFEATGRLDAIAACNLAAEIVKCTSDAVIAKTLSGVITSWNPGAERLFGYTAQEIIGRSVQTLIPPEAFDLEKEILEKIRLGESVEHVETVRLRKDRQRIIVSVNVSPLKDLAGQVIGVANVLNDITQRKQAEQAQRDAEQRFLTMANSIPQLAWIARADGFIYWYNEQWYAYTGTTPEQMEGWGWQTVHDPVLLPKIMENWLRALSSGEPFEMEFPLRDSQGRFRSFLTRTQPLKDAEGRVVQWFGTNTDVDELKLMEKSLRASQARLNSTLAAGSIGTWTWDIANDRLCADEFTARMFSIEPAAAANGLSAAIYLEAVAKEDQPAVAASLARAIESCGEYDVEYRVRQGNGEIIWLQAKGRVEGDGAGRALHFHGAVIDISQRKKTDGDIRQLNAELELRVVERTAQLESANIDLVASNKELEAFSYSVSHDLRGPLRAVDGFSQIMMENYSDQLPEEGRRHLRTIREGAQRMGSLIDDLLAFAQLSRTALKKRVVDTDRLVCEVIDELSPQREGRQVEIRIDGLPQCQGDTALLRQVWVNLLSNALKYTRKCELAVLEIGCTREKDEDVYFVRDNGTGFEMKYAHKLFEVFQRLHRAEDYEGTGVGLAIVQRIIQRHGGRVWADATMDRGATFYFTLEGEAAL